MAEAPWRQAAAPPPPPGATGHIPASRLKSDVSGRVEPPLCVQNAMLTKDKKPFTYTPGGIDLSEIRSPRMQRRLEMNAMNEGVGPTPQPQPNYPTGPLPPSALAAMQPQLQVQVFPSGKVPQPHHGGAPPPPPPPKAPPMMRSTSPVPMDAFERPDMTKIIPENPMALLRKTSGPVIKRDPIFNKDNYNGNAAAPPPMRPVQKMESPPVRQPEPPQPRAPTSGVGSIYIPPVNQGAAPPTPPQRHHQSPSFVNQIDSPNDNRVAPPFYKRQPSTPQSEPQSPPTVASRQPPGVATVVQREREREQTPESPKATLSKAPTPWLSQKRQQSQDVPEWAVNDNRGQTSPPVHEQLQQKVQIQPEPPQKQPVRPWQQQQQQQPQQPPWQQEQQQQQPQPQQQQQPWQQRQQQQPEAQPWQQQQPEAQPWQQRQKQQPEAQPWQQRQQQPEPQPWQQQQQSRPAQSPPVQIPQGGGVRKQMQNREQPQNSGPTQRTEVVIVNDPPQVFQHPGQATQRTIVRQQQPQQNNFQQQQQPGVRVIPVQVDGASSNGHVRSPTTPGGNSDARSLNRQLSWNSNPTQSNTFRVLQKITNTDGDDDDDQPVIEHSPKTPQNFPQRQVSMEQMRKMKQNEGDQELMNKFKQVPQNQQNNKGGPVVRTIPIQIEGGGPTKAYVPPSEQTVQEPKKYMGSSIPSRSFKILQAMTGPDDCANPERACENNENYPNDPSSFAHWGFDPNYPPPSPYYYDPYWTYYSQNYPAPSNEVPPEQTQNNARMTPIPHNWGYYAPPYGQNRASTERSESDAELKKKNLNSRTTPVPWANDTDPNKKQNGSARCTPVPFWPYYYPNYSCETASTEQNHEIQKTDSNGNAPCGEDQQNYTQYPPYWDPYYYGYYYGAPPPMYPPVYSPYPYYPPQQNDTEEISGYSSNDEMSYYGSRFATMTPFSNSRCKSVTTPNRSTTPSCITTPARAATPSVAISNRVATPSLSQQLLVEIKQAARKMEENRRNREEVKEKPVEKIRIQSEPFEDDSSVADTSDSDNEMIGYEICRKPVSLQAIRSVSNIQVYDDEESSHCSDEDEVSEDTTEENEESSSVCAADETIPHQLSVIFEESERTDSSARYVRESSVATTISEDTIENSEDEEEALESDGTVLVKLPLTFKFTIAESQKVATLTVGNSQVMPQMAVKSAVKDMCATRIASTSEMENYLGLQNDISRQVSSDSYETAESDLESVQTVKHVSPDSLSSNVSVENCDETENSANEGEDVDWWGELSKSEDVPTTFSDMKEAVVYNDEKNAHANEDLITNDNTLNIINPKRVGQEENNFHDKEKEIYIESNYAQSNYINSNEEEIDFWASIEKDEWSSKAQSHNVEDATNQETSFAPSGDEAKSYVTCEENYQGQLDFWTSVQTEEATALKQKTVEEESNTEFFSASEHGEVCNNSENGISDIPSSPLIESCNNLETHLNSMNDLNKQQTIDVPPDVDFWAELIETPKAGENDNDIVETIHTSSTEQVYSNEEKDTSSACSRNSSLTSSTVSGKKEHLHERSNCQEYHEAFTNHVHEIQGTVCCENDIKTEEGSHCNDVIDNSDKTYQYSTDNTADDADPDVKPLSVQERIQVLQAAATYRQSQQQEDETEIQFSVKERISAFEDNPHLSTDKVPSRRKSVSRKNSVKSYEEFSEEEGDSGVTSDVSRHVSEGDIELDFLEPKKPNKYQRASTHSRLFRLLQDECDNEEEDDVPENTKEEKHGQGNMQSRREHLNLPLQKTGSDPESFSSSGFTSPGSPTINDRLVNELIQSLIKKKQGRIFKNMTLDKLQAAALRILQDDMDGLETLSSSEDGGSFLSPKKPGTGSSTPAQTPQEYGANLNEYNQYYDSWAQAERLYDAQHEVLPSKTFRLIQEHSATNKTGAIAGLLARCPRVLSNKNVQKELMRLIEDHTSPAPSPVPIEQPPDASEVTNAS